MNKTIVFLSGIQGSGKTLHGKNLVEHLGYGYFSIGQYLRELKESKPNNQICQNNEQGLLAPSDFANSLFKTDILDQSGNFIVDGYPRAVDQVEYCLPFIKDFEVQLILFEAPDDVIMRRLNKRARADDSPKSIQNRFDSWKEDTKPAIELLQNRLKLIPIIIDTNREKDIVWNDLTDKVSKQAATV